MKSNKNIFFVGPASVGKSTVGKLLAEKLDYVFVDIDQEFRERIALIPDYVKSKGYVEYCEANSILTDKLIEENRERTVFATPSGFLVHDYSPHLIEKHLNILKNYVSILLLPHRNPHEAVDLMIQRQRDRWGDVKPEIERTRFLERFEKYKNYGDIQIYSLESPEVIVEEILFQL
jgi:shikimate kinase